MGRRDVANINYCEGQYGYIREQFGHRLKFATPRKGYVSSGFHRLFGA